jgi:hypothetical protein
LIAKQFVLAASDLTASGHFLEGVIKELGRFFREIRRSINAADQIGCLSHSGACIAALRTISSTLFLCVFNRRRMISHGWYISDGHKISSLVLKCEEGRMGDKPI